MPSPFPTDVSQAIEASGIVAVLVVEQEAHAVPLAKALVEGGITAIELTLRTPAALAAAQAIKNAVPEVLLGIGTVLTTEQVQQAADLEAAFAVAPGLNPRIVRRAAELGLPFAPGIVTPSDIEAALELGCTELKFFPAEPSGGLEYLTSMAAPYQHLGVRFVPLGGLSQENFEPYIRSPLIRAVGGSWIAPSKLILSQQWQTITQRAAAAADVVRSVREGN